MKTRTVITPTAGPAQAGGRAAAPARVGMFAPSGLLEAIVDRDPELIGSRTRAKKAGG